MSNESRRLTRKQLAAFAPDQRTLRALEQMTEVVSDELPRDIAALYRMSEESSIDAGLANSKANEALDALKSIARNLELMASMPDAPFPRSFPVDYIDWNGEPPHADKQRRMAWNPSEDTLNLHHAGDVTQQIGNELYAYISVNAGPNLLNGQVIGFNPVANTHVPFIANGTYNTFQVIGVATQDIPNGSPGRVTVWGRVRNINTTGTPVGETWTAGQLLYVSTTVAGGFTNVKPTAPNQSIPIAQVRVVSATIGEVFVRPTIEQEMFYGAFTKLSDQTPAAINTAYAITWTNTEVSNGVSIGTPTSRIVATNAGLYQFCLSVQLTSSSASVKNVWIWFRKNGVNVANSSIITSLDSATAIRAPSRTLFFSLQAGDYIEVMFAADSTAMTIDNIASTAFAPAAPAAILTVNQEQQ